MGLKIASGKPILGIMSHQFKSFLYYAKLSKICIQEGFSGLILFNPEDVDFIRRRISAWVYAKGKWGRAKVRYPDLVYDIGYYRTDRTLQRAVKFMTKANVPFLGYWPGDKWDIHQTLMDSKEISKHCIATIRFTDMNELFTFAEKYGSILLKPVNGDSGQGIIRLTLKDGKIYLDGNNKTMDEYTKESVSHRLKPLSNGTYIAQERLDITGVDGKLWDLRTLVQKNGEGKWSLTGTAVRQGEPGKITTNLETGGKVAQTLPYLRSAFGENQTKKLLLDMESLSLLIAQHMEQAMQKQFVELGIDLAILKDSSIRIIEINHKPGKKIMKSKHDPNVYRESIEKPLKYASFLSVR